MLLAFRRFGSRSRSPGHATRAARSLALAFLLTMGLPAISAESARTADRIIAIVNDEVITLSEMKAEIRGEEAQLRQQYKGTDFDRRLRKLEYKALTRLIERRLQLQVAREKGFEPTEAEVMQAIQNIQRQGDQVDPTDPQLRQTVRDQLTVMRVLEREVNSGVTVTENDLKRYYEDHLTRFMLPVEYHLSQIVIRPKPGESSKETRRRAMAVYAELKDGADFAKVARLRSDGREAFQDGSLGFVRGGELELSIERAITGLKPGEMTEPLSMDDGFHIMRVDERKPPEFLQYAQVKGQIHNMVYEQKSQDRYHKWIDQLKDKSYIEVKF